MAVEKSAKSSKWGLFSWMTNGLEKLKRTHFIGNYASWTHMKPWNPLTEGKWQLDYVVQELASKM